ncbi:hypothetical protein [Streptomyces sp. NPDC056600]|uniref:hypothetical protein n=1 Tax=Streptomyces sp. NPDC056600 TaxID=3345874 RepID=UPI0036831F91
MSRRWLRRVAWAVVPAELLTVVCLAAGVDVPPPLLVAAEITVAALLMAEAVALLRLRRAGLSWREAAGELVPEPVLRLAGHELRLWQSLLLWVRRARHGLREGDVAFGHARGDAAMMYGLLFVCLVETVGLSVLLADWPAAHAVVLVLDVQTVLFLLGLRAAAVVRPHVLGGGVLRVRSGAHLDLAIPLERIASVRRRSAYAHAETEGELNLPVGSQTSIVLELREAVRAPRLLGGGRAVRVVRFHADEPDALYAALVGALRPHGEAA